MKVAQKLVINYYRTKLNMLAMISSRKAAERAFELFCTPLKRSNTRIPAIFSEGEELTFSLENNIIRGHRWNHPAVKKVLVVHGFESSYRNFDRYISSLINKGYEVLAFDAPAHGSSGGTQINLPLYVAAVTKIYHDYGPVDYFLGHSYGALIIAHFLESTVHDTSTKAVLIAPATETTTTIDSFCSFLHLNDAVKKELNQLIYDKSGFWPDHYSIRRAMHHIHAEVLWFHDEDDELTPVSDALKVKEDNHPNVQFRISKGLGHRRIYRDNNVIKEVVDFL